MFERIAKESRRVWQGDIKAWVEQDKTHGLCIFKRRGHHILPFIVARFNTEMNQFVESRSFTNWLEAWVYFTSRAEMDFDGEKGSVS